MPWVQIRSGAFWYYQICGQNNAKNALSSAPSKPQPLLLGGFSKCHLLFLLSGPFLESLVKDTQFFWLVPLPNYLTDKKEFDLCLGISHYLACRSNLAKHFTVCYLWPLTVRSQLLDLHSHNENQWVMMNPSRSVMIESNLSRSECVVLQTPHLHFDSGLSITELNTCKIEVTSAYHCCDQVDTGSEDESISYSKLSFRVKKSWLSSIPVSKQLQIRAESSVTPGVYSSIMSGSAPDSCGVL